MSTTEQARRELLWISEQHDDAVAWAKANGIDPNRIPADDGVYIVGDTIHYREFAKSLDGTAANVISFGGGCGVTGWMTTPLLADPDTFGLTTVSVTAGGR